MSRPPRRRLGALALATLAVLVAGPLVPRSAGAATTSSDAYLVYVDEQGSLRAWRPSSGERRLLLDNVQVAHFAASADGNRLAVSTVGGVLVLDSAAATEHFVADDPTDPSMRMWALSADGHTLHSLTEAGVVAVDVATGDCRTLLHLDPAGVSDLEASPDGRYLAVVTSVAPGPDPADSFAAPGAALVLDLLTGATTWTGSPYDRTGQSIRITFSGTGVPVLDRFDARDRALVLRGDDGSRLFPGTQARNPQGGRDGIFAVTADASDTGRAGRLLLAPADGGPAHEMARMPADFGSPYSDYKVLHGPLPLASTRRAPAEDPQLLTHSGSGPVLRLPLGALVHTAALGYVHEPGRVDAIVQSRSGPGEQWEMQSTTRSATDGRLHDVALPALQATRHAQLRLLLNRVASRVVTLRVTARVSVAPQTRAGQVLTGSVRGTAGGSVRLERWDRGAWRAQLTAPVRGSRFSARLPESDRRTLWRVVRPRTASFDRGTSRAVRVVPASAPRHRPPDTFSEASARP